MAERRKIWQVPSCNKPCGQQQRKSPQQRGRWWCRLGWPLRLKIESSLAQWWKIKGPGILCCCDLKFMHFVAKNALKFLNWIWGWPPHKWSFFMNPDQKHASRISAPLLFWCSGGSRLIWTNKTKNPTNLVNFEFYMQFSTWEKENSLSHNFKQSIFA